jgi:hypothetical protein
MSRGLEAVGDAGRELPLPLPCGVVSTPRFVIYHRGSHTFQKLRQRRILEYHVLHGCATASCVAEVVGPVVWRADVASFGGLLV